WQPAHAQRSAGCADRQGRRPATWPPRRLPGRHAHDQPLPHAARSRRRAPRGARRQHRPRRARDGDLGSPIAYPRPVSHWFDSVKGLPDAAGRAALVGRAWLADVDGPAVVAVIGDGLHDLSRVAATCTQLLDLEDPVAAVRDAGKLPRVGSVDEVLATSAFDRRDPRVPWLLAPCDLQAIKASGVTFVPSLLERVIEEQTRGDARKAESARQSIGAIIVQHGGSNLREIRPGSPQARAVHDALMAQGIWSQYLEVGIGPDAHIFTQAHTVYAA